MTIETRIETKSREHLYVITMELTRTNDNMWVI